MPTKVVVLVSGGLDSVVALYDAHQQHTVVGALTFNYGSKHNPKEIPCAAFHCAKLGVPHQIIQLDCVGELFRSSLLVSGGAIPDGHYAEPTMQQTVVPFRNGIMLSIAAGYAESIGAEGVVIAAHAGDHAIYPDCRADFMESMAEAIRLGTYANLALFRPFLRFNKSQIAARGHRLGVDLARTWSCYKGGDLHCGTCGTCVERHEAFALAGLPDPTVYQSTTLCFPKPAGA